MSRRWRTLALRVWRPGDERAFEVRPDMAEEAAAVSWEWWLAGMPGPTWTLVRPSTGEVMGMGGGIEQRPGDWQLWSLLAKLPLRDWPSALACAAQAIRTLQREFDARHFTALAREDSPAAWRTLVRLGFNYYGASMYWRGYVIFERRAQRRRRVA